MLAINEVTRSAAGEVYLHERLFYMGYLTHFVYPNYFGRNTTNQTFKYETTEISLGPPIKPFRYFPNNESGYWEGYDVAMNRYNLYGGYVQGDRYIYFEEFTGESEEQDTVYSGTEDYATSGIPEF